MDNAFDYSNIATGRNFIGRENDIRTLANLINKGENVIMFCPPKSGRHSAIQRTLLEIKSGNNDVTAIEIKLHEVRNRQEFLIKFGNAILKAAASTTEGYKNLVSTYLEGSHFIFDQKQYANSGSILSLNWDIDEEDSLAMLRFPYLLASDTAKRIVIIFDEFQMLDKTEDSYHLFKIMESILKEVCTKENTNSCSLLITGSEVNAMKDIFEKRKLFFRMAQIYQLSPIDEKAIIDHIHRGFMSSGKVVDSELLLGVCKLFKNNVWYINHFMAICDHLSKGYIMEPIMKQALNMMLAIHEPRFRSESNSLTGFQLQYLKAILDGHKKFSSTEVISNYGLNSSANVKRVREALVKKEIITFNDKDEPEFLDPLFEYWIKKYFFIPLQS